MTLSTSVPIIVNSNVFPLKIFRKYSLALSYICNLESNTEKSTNGRLRKIGAGAFQKLSKQKSVKIFSLSLHEVDQRLIEKSHQSSPFTDKSLNISTLQQSHFRSKNVYKIVPIYKRLRP